jgi:hypothetical protein
MIRSMSTEGLAGANFKKKKKDEHLFICLENRLRRFLWLSIMGSHGHACSRRSLPARSESPASDTLEEGKWVSSRLYKPDEESDEGSYEEVAHRTLARNAPKAMLVLFYGLATVTKYVSTLAPGQLDHSLPKQELRMLTMQIKKIERDRRRVFSEIDIMHLVVFEDALLGPLPAPSRATVFVIVR